ncbi:hypothetical protein LQG66_33525 [Bradyrhizobium ontarionense]|uniref:Uncharacterized protein n=1 Tax=Bradyrhizobium ontarionense TaxID=2898149 RepID=A0ABY3R9K5_9BRAD|nr:DUF6714 family protein [Bradyrhizobium sp. A19]UFZ04060.1 hypothetical protein LQG66_33525 [Bradyrhizobium sp. A19]
MRISTDAVIDEIGQAFPASRQSRFLPLVNSAQGDEPLRVIAAFDDKDDWTKLAPEWLDMVPSGLGSALSFLSDQAICFYIPAYIVADMTTSLQMVDPTFTLTCGFDRRSHNKRIRPQSEETWTEYCRNRWSRLTHAQAVAIVHYLEWRVLRDRRDLVYIVDSSIVEALGTYWYDRAATSQER